MSMMGDTYKVSISGAGLTLEREVPAHVGEQVVVLILSGKPGQISEAPAGEIGRTNGSGGGGMCRPTRPTVVCRSAST